MKHFLREYFTFEKNERNGIITLFFVLCFICLFFLIYKNIDNTEPIDYSQFSKEIKEFEASLKPKDKDFYENRLNRYIAEKYDTLSLFKFNPNKIDSLQWKKLGLTEKQIKNIGSYKKRGGTFYVKDDLRKIYSIRTKQYQYLKPYIQLPDKKNRKNKYKRKQKNEIKVENLFTFNPNIVSEEEMQQLGLTKKQIKTIINYRNKGGFFRKKKDFSKIYAISKKQYNILKNYIDIPQKEEKTSEIEKEEVIKIELNSASEEDLIKLKGIGKSYANRILKFRKKLGGFVDKKQLLEVYGFKKETYDKVEKFIILNINEIKKININFAEFRDLIKHPYINKKQTNAILKFRTKNGSYQNISKLLEAKIFSQEEFEKIKHYLTKGE